jgi:glycosyltransferase involved in cell wall biosynthesis
VSDVAITINTVLGGPRYYAQNLIENILQLDRDNRYVIIADSSAYRPPKGFASRCEIVDIPMRSKYSVIFWDHLKVPAAVRKRNIDLLHHTKGACPLFSRTPTVVSIYDLAVYVMPETFAPGQRWYLRSNYEYAARKARRIITISENSKNDIVKFLGVPAERIAITPLAASPEFTKIDDKPILQSVKNKYHLPENYLLYMGTIHPRKNLTLLINAYAAARRRDAFPHQLVIAGRKGWLTQEIFKTAEKFSVLAPVIFPGTIDEPDKPALICGAAAFVSPSLYEGFGLTLLEAMQCGKPVISSNVSSIPEVAGDAAVLVDPKSEEQLARAISRVLCDEALQKKMGEQAVRKSREFSWTRTAQMTLDVYRSILD